MRSNIYLILFVLLICRVILDRCTADLDDMWSTLDFTIHDSKRETADSNATATATTTVKKEWYTFNIIILNYIILLFVLINYKISSFVIFSLREKNSNCITRFLHSYFCPTGYIFDQRLRLCWCIVQARKVVTTTRTRT